MDILRLVDLFRGFAASGGFVPKRPVGLRSPIFPKELNMSAGHNFAMECLSRATPLTPVTKYSLFEKTFRRIDLERVGHSAHHLSFFQVALTAYAGSGPMIAASMDEAVDGIVRFITKVLGVPGDKLLVTYFDGGRVKQFVLQPEPFRDCWLKTGLSADQVIPILGRRNLVFTESEGTAVCPTCEIFYDKGERFEGPNRYVEIGSVNVYKYIYHQRANSLNSTTNWVLNCLVGVERVLLATQGVPTIYDIDCVRPLVGIVESRLPSAVEKTLYAVSARMAADAIRSIVFICSEDFVIDATPQGRILKHLVKQLVSQLRYLHVYDPDVVGEGVRQTISTFEGLYPELKNVGPKVIQLVATEIANREGSYGG